MESTGGDRKTPPTRQTAGKQTQCGRRKTNTQTAEREWRDVAGRAWEPTRTMTAAATLLLPCRPTGGDMDGRTAIDKESRAPATVTTAFRQPLPLPIATHGPADHHLEEIAPGARGDSGIPSTVALADRDAWNLRTTTKKNWPSAMTATTAFRPPWPCRIATHGPADNHSKEMALGAHSEHGLPSTVAPADRH